MREAGHSLHRVAVGHRSDGAVGCNEKAEFLPVIDATGGTDPSVALADLANQRYDKAQHIVLIMTDGEWSGNQGKGGYLAAYKEDGRVFIGLGYRYGRPCW